MGILLNKDTKGIKVAIAPRYVTRKATDRPIRKVDGGFVIVTIKNPKQLIDIMATATLYAISNDGKYYHLTTENAVDIYEKISEDKQIEESLAKPVENIDNIIGAPRITAFFTAADDADGKDFQSDVVFSNGELYGIVFEQTGTVAGVKPATNKDGYTVAVKYDNTAATKHKITDVKIRVNTIGEAVSVDDGLNKIWLGKDVSVVGLIVSAKIDEKDVEENVKVKLIPIKKYTKDSFSVRSSAPNAERASTEKQENAHLPGPRPTEGHTTHSGIGKKKNQDSDASGQNREGTEITTPGRGRRSDDIGGVGSASETTVPPTPALPSMDDHL